MRSGWEPKIDMEKRYQRYNSKRLFVQSVINGSIEYIQLNYETVIECLYRLSVNDNIIFQPEIQYIIHPGAQASINNAFVAILRAGISF